MTMSEYISWKRVSIEASAIVVSILFAFAIDAWWDEQVERRDEQAQLDRLRVEFEENIRMINIRSFEQPIIDAVVDVYEMISAAQQRGAGEVTIPMTVMAWAIAAPTFDADTPILNGLIRSGRLEIIEDMDVLALIADWDRTLRDYTAFAERARRTTDTHMVPALIRSGDISEILMTPIRFNQVDPGNFGDRTITLQIDNELKGFVAERWQHGRIAVRRLTDAEGIAKELVAAINAAVDD